MKWNFNPVLFSYGVISIHWYGVIFAVAISIGFHIFNTMVSREGKPQENYEIFI